MTSADTLPPEEALPTVLILGGTSEARALAERLVMEANRFPVRVVSSLAGRVSRPRLPLGEVRVGGFGGPEGLARWVKEKQVAVIVDATHPFAEKISNTAHQVSRLLHLPLVALHRPQWEKAAGDRWIRVRSMSDAARETDHFERAFLTIGRQQLAAFAGVATHCVVRCVEPPEGPVPLSHEILLDRGPFTVEAEIALLRSTGCQVVVTKNSGGPATYGKIIAARTLGIPVIVVDRPKPMNPSPYCQAVTTVDDAAAAVGRVVGESAPS